MYKRGIQIYNFRIKSEYAKDLLKCRVVLVHDKIRSFRPKIVPVAEIYS